MSAINKAVPGKVSNKAKRLIVILYGLRALGQKLPPPEALPQFDNEIWVEISQSGYILGSPDKYILNDKKFNVELNPLSTASKTPPAVLSLLKHYKALHERYKRGKLGSSERDLVQIRYLLRQFDPHKVQPMMELFFREPLIKARKGKLYVQDFFLWAKRRLQKEAKK